MSNSAVVNSNLVKELNEAKNTFVAFLEAKGCDRISESERSVPGLFTYYNHVDAFTGSGTFYVAHFVLHVDGAVYVKYIDNSRRRTNLSIKEFLELIKNQ